MRGKVPDIPPTHDENRITPAYAGKSFTRVVTSAVHGDHPRLCGEKWKTLSTTKPVKGSPPPMRGKGKADL